MLDQTVFAEPTRSAGFERLADFLPNAGRRYTKTRNFDFGPDQRGNVSMLSPYLRHRLLSEPDVLARVLAIHSRPAADKFVQEIFWRAYFKGWLEQHPDAWHNYRHDVDAWRERLASDADLGKRYETAISGSTGIDCFDAWTRELVATGYLHNHARMWFASIWVYTLELPWQLGADFFLRHLLDGDPASNTLSWRWVCGLHTKGKTYLARISNITSYTDDRFNPAGQLAVSAPPLTEAERPRRRPLPDVEEISFDAPWALLVTEDDCSLEREPFASAPAAVLGLTAFDSRSPFAVGQPAAAFASGAVADGVDRASRTFDCDGSSAEGADWGEHIAAFAAAAGVDVVVAPYAPVGPTAERLAAAEAALEGQGIRVYRYRRRYDARAWPFADRGYFRLKKKIPSLLDAMSL